jgi:hypothetical protein
MEMAPPNGRRGYPIIDRRRISYQIWSPLAGGRGPTRRLRLGRLRTGEGATRLLIGVCTERKKNITLNEYNKKPFMFSFSIEVLFFKINLRKNRLLIDQKTLFSTNNNRRNVNP